MLVWVMIVWVSWTNEIDMVLTYLEPRLPPLPLLHTRFPWGKS